MLPLKDDNPTRRFPILTVILIAVNIAIFGYQFSRPDSPAFSRTPTSPDVFYESGSQQAFACQWGLVPDYLVHGSQPPQNEVGVDNGQQVRVRSCETFSQQKPRGLGLLTHQFLHGSWFHVLGNMLFLWIFGNNIEDRLGRIRFLPFYLLCGVIAGLTQTAINTSTGFPLIGASGAIAGVLGAYILLYPNARVWTLIFIFPLRVPAWIVLGLWFAFQFIYASGAGETGSGVAYWAHVGGFIAGLVLIKLFLAGRPPPPPARPAIPVY